MNYDKFIAKTRLIKKIESVTTTGDVKYCGTALEISDKQGKELFHFVIDKEGILQILVLKSSENYRMPLELLEKIISRAREVVKKVY